MDKIVKIAQTVQQDHLYEKQQWNTLHKTQKTKNKMLNKQLSQTQAMILSLERENERLWRMFSLEKPVHNKKRKHNEIVDLTEDDEPVMVIKEEPVMVIKKEMGVDIEQLIENLQDMAIIQNNIQIKLEEKSIQPEIESETILESETDKEAESEPDQEAESDQEEPDQEEPDQEEPDSELASVSNEPAQENEEEEEEEAISETEEEKKARSVQEPLPQEEEEEEVFLVTIDGKSYFTTNEKNGMLYGVTSDGDVGEEVGYYENGEAGFYEE
jgi:hypothetical protein